MRLPQVKSRGARVTSAGRKNAVLEPEECSRLKDQLQGKAEELKGKATGNRGEQAKGRMRQAIGNMKRTARDIRDDVRAEASRRRERERDKESGRPTPSG